MNDVYENVASHIEGLEQEVLRLKDEVVEIRNTALIILSSYRESELNRLYHIYGKERHSHTGDLLKSVDEFMKLITKGNHNG